MSRLLRSCLLAAFGLASTITALAVKNYLPDRDTPVPADQQIPVIDFTRPYLFKDARLNPAGTMLAAFSKNEGLGDNVMIIELATGKIQRTVPGIDSFTWLDNTHLRLNGSENHVIDVQRPKIYSPEKVLLSYEKRGMIAGSDYLRTWPLPTDLGEWTTEGTWYSPQDGHVKFMSVRKHDGRKYLLRREDDKWKECPVDVDEVTPLLAGEKPGEIIVLGPRAKGKPRAIQRLDAVTGQLGEIIYQDERDDCAAILHYKRGTRIINGVVVPNRVEQVVWLDEKMQQVQNVLRQQFPGMLAKIVSTSLDETIFLIEVESDRQPPTLYLLDNNKKSLGLIKNLAPWIDPKRMQPMQVISFKVRDGSRLEAYLVLPANASKEHPAPLVVDIHGGPWSRHSWGWDRGAQFFANRGYAVLMPNYRGSDGYDSRFEKEDHYDFQKMHQDVTDSVRAAIKTGLVDSRRIAALGVGFGGYLAMCGAIEEPGLYRCAITLGGVFDWEKRFNERSVITRSLDSEAAHSFDYWLQAKLKDRTLFSPLQKVEDLKIPVFLTRNLFITDITFESQVFDLGRAIKGRTAVPCVTFGDLNIYRENEAYSEVVERTTKFEEFLAKYMAP